MRENEQGSSVTGVDPERLFAAAPEALLVVRGRRIELANEMARAFLGCDPAGLEIHEVIADWVEGADAGVPFESTIRSPAGGELAAEVRVQGMDGSTAIVAIRDARALIAGREAEAALTEAETRYRSLVEQIPAVVYADDGEITTYVSPQIQQILGVSAEAYRQDPDMWLRMVHPDDRAQVQAESDAFLAGSGRDLSDYRMVRPDGRTVWVRDRAFAFRDADGQVMWEHGLLFDVTELKEAEARVAEMAFYDRLTGLANRVLFEETLALAIERSKRNATFLGVLFLDLDNFKLVNDSLGHHAGDTLLTQIAARLRGCTRDTDLVARQGGDEFLILVADLDAELADGAIRSVADRVNDAMREPFDVQDIEFHARGSMGISVYPRDARDTVGLLKNADIAMYQAKRLEPGGYRFFAADEDDAAERLSFATRLREAVDDENWVLDYQPVVDLADGRVVGAEALIRWRDASGGIVPPGDFISVAEELGLIEAIGGWVADEVGRQQREWIERGLDLQLSFNVSPRQLWTPRFAERLLERFRAAGVEPSSLTAEITESSAMADPDRTQRVLHALHSWGLRLAIDDFGTGYSSLSRLQHMPVQVLKIDREFVRDVDGNALLAGMVRAMIQVAESLEMTPVAVGIETEAEHRFLRSIGCTLGQGFWFARPMPAERLSSLAVNGEIHLPSSDLSGRDR
jgi:diguanylate cyclase (GGDEF)-like protein/PAS domain S-box-containing protein